jgi:hypothetical protein
VTVGFVKLFKYLLSGTKVVLKWDQTPPKRPRSGRYYRKVTYGKFVWSANSKV